MNYKDYLKASEAPVSKGRYLKHRTSVIRDGLTSTEDIKKYSPDELLADLGEFKLQDGSLKTLDLNSFNGLFKWKEGEKGFSNYQIWAIWLAYIYNRSFVVCKMGLGKTAIAMGAITLERLKQKSKPSKLQCNKPFLFLVPQATAVDGIIREFKSRSSFRVSKLTTKQYANWQSSASGEDLLVCTYATFLRLVSTSEEVSNSRLDSPNSTKTSLVIQPHLVSMLRDRIAGGILDEGQSVKSGVGGISQAATVTFDSNFFSGFLLVMTGTPTSKIGDDIFHTMKVVDGGYTLGTNLSKFRAEFCKEVNAGKITTFQFQSSLIPTLVEKLSAERVIFIDVHHTEEKFPNFTFLYKEVPLTPSHSVQIAQLRASSAANPTTAYMKTMMYLAGLRNTTATEKSEGKGTHTLIANPPKIPVLIQTIQEITSKASANHNVGLVFHHHILSETLISEALSKNNIPYLVLKDHPLEYVQNRMEEAKRNKSTLIIIAQNVSGGSSLNLQTATFIVYYNLPIGVTNLDQSSARIRRRTSEKEASQERLLAFIISIEYEDASLVSLLKNWEMTNGFFDNSMQPKQALKEYKRFLSQKLSTNNASDEIKVGGVKRMSKKRHIRVAPVKIDV